MDVRERERLVQVALRVVLGDAVDRIRTEPTNEYLLVRPVDDEGGFGVWTSDDVQDADVRPFLERVIDLCADELTESSPFWGVRLPLCPLHPDLHALTVCIGADAVSCSCPVAGVVRTVPC